jgi:hypothetical protein
MRKSSAILVSAIALGLAMFVPLEASAQGVSTTSVLVTQPTVVRPLQTWHEIREYSGGASCCAAGPFRNCSVRVSDSPTPSLVCIPSYVAHLPSLTQFFTTTGCTARSSTAQLRERRRGAHSEA